MTNKRLTIENLDNLEELNTDEVFSIEGGLLIDSSIKAEKVDISIPEKVDISIEDKLIYPVEPGPIKPFKPYPLPYCRPYPLPYCHPYPTKGGNLPWCAVVL